MTVFPSTFPAATMPYRAVRLRFRAALAGTLATLPLEDKVLHSTAGQFVMGLEAAIATPESYIPTTTIAAIPLALLTHHDPPALLRLVSFVSGDELAYALAIAALCRHDLVLTRLIPTLQQWLRACEEATAAAIAGLDAVQRLVARGESLTVARQILAARAEMLALYGFLCVPDDFAIATQRAGAEVCLVAALVGAWAAQLHGFDPASLRQATVLGDRLFATWAGLSSPDLLATWRSVAVTAPDVLGKRL